MKRFCLLFAALGLFLGNAGQAQSGPIIYGSAYLGPHAGNQPAANLYRIDSGTGAATLIGPIGFNNVGAMDFDPTTGILYGEGKVPGTGADVLITINTATGAGTLVGPTGLPPSGNGAVLQDMSFRNSDGRLYAYLSGDLYTINKTTGLATLVGNADNGFGIGNGLAFSPNDTLFHAAGGEPEPGTDRDFLSTIDPNTGAETHLFPLNFQPPFQLPLVGPNAMDFDNATGILYASVVQGNESGTITNYLATIDTNSGDVNAIGVTVNGLDAIAVAPVPEPGGLILLGTGVLGLVGYGWRRRKTRTE